MAEAILVPQVGQDLTEAKVVALHVKVGDQVKKGDVVAEVESEKASFEVEAFSSGTVTHIAYKLGDTATVLQPLLFVGDAGEKVEAAASDARRRKRRNCQPITTPAKANQSWIDRASSLVALGAKARFHQRARYFADKRQRPARCRRIQGY